ncbi:hypothetical protein SAMN04490357_0135 [Streptomyces misionensis]|uniref:Uncharacterized protein n=1 Tax=Streptomyces misionensis TaxID=67331 RepID=A0A1H4IB46_9ACTN|nr:hypothetical protein [Streptomyces misionensis]SEB31231.1 hypothetical protein SAMN04490357_0135 [Streptomyces misionensis]
MERLSGAEAARDFPLRRGDYHPVGDGWLAQSFVGHVTQPT